MGDVEVDVWTGGEIDETAALRLLQFIRSGGLHLAQTNGRQKHSNHRKWRNAGRWRQLSFATFGYPAEKPIPFICPESLVTLKGSLIGLVEAAVVVVVAGVVSAREAGGTPR